MLFQRGVYMLSNPLMLDFELERKRADLHSAIINAHGNLQAPDVLAASAALDKVIVLMQNQLGQASTPISR